jgi:hypothetical protein
LKIVPNLRFRKIFLTISLVGLQSVHLLPLDEVNTTRQNPILREYFRERVTANTIVLPSWNRRPRPAFSTPLVERRIDYLIAEFLKKLKENRILLRTHLEDYLTERQLLANAENYSQWNAGLTSLESSLKKIEDLSKRLRKDLSFPLVALKSKSDFEAKLTEVSLGSVFEVETSFLKREITLADSKISEYFFTPKNTISVQALSSDTMMSHLHKVQKMAQIMRRGIQFLVPPFHNSSPQLADRG